MCTHDPSFSSDSAIVSQCSAKTDKMSCESSIEEGKSCDNIDIFNILLLQDVTPHDCYDRCKYDGNLPLGKCSSFVFFVDKGTNKCILLKPGCNLIQREGYNHYSIKPVLPTPTSSNGNCHTAELYLTGKALGNYFFLQSVPSL